MMNSRDLPEARLIGVYSLEEIAAEKTMALADPARTEPRDLYDLWYLTSNESVEMDQLIPGICEKLEFRGRPCKGLQLAIAGKEARLRPLWTRRLAYQMTSLPPFEPGLQGIAQDTTASELAVNMQGSGAL